MADINLIPQEAKKSEDVDRLRSKLTVISIIALVLTALGAIVTLAFFAYFVSQRDNLISRVEQASVTVNNYKENEELLVVAKDKASTAEKVLSSRLDQGGVFATLAQIIPKDVYFTDIKIASRQMQVNGKAKTSADIAGLVSALLSQEGAKIVSGVSINSLSSDETGAYTFALSAAVN